MNNHLFPRGKFRGRFNASSTSYRNYPLSFCSINTVPVIYQSGQRPASTQRKEKEKRGKMRTCNNSLTAFQNWPPRGHLRNKFSSTRCLIRRYVSLFNAKDAPTWRENSRRANLRSSDLSECFSASQRCQGTLASATHMRNESINILHSGH